MVMKLLATKFELLKPILKRHKYLNWLSPLLVMVSPLIVAFFTALPFTMKMSLTPFQSPLHLISSVVHFSASHLPGYLFICSGLLFLCATNSAQVMLGHRVTAILVALISIYLMLKIWTFLPTIHIASGLLCYKNLSSNLLVVSPQFWVHIVGTIFVLLLFLNLITVIGQEKPA
jgi:hypothetical protein